MFIDEPSDIAEVWNIILDSWLRLITIFNDNYLTYEIGFKPLSIILCSQPHNNRIRLNIFCDYTVSLYEDTITYVCFFYNKTFLSNPNIISQIGWLPVSFFYLCLIVNFNKQLTFWKDKKWCVNISTIGYYLGQRITIEAIEDYLAITLGIMHFLGYLVIILIEKKHLLG